MQIPHNIRSFYAQIYSCFIAESLDYEGVSASGITEEEAIESLTKQLDNIKSNEKK